MGPPTLSFLLTRQGPESCLSREVPRWPETPPRPQPTLLRQPRCCSRRPPAVLKTPPASGRHDWVVYAKPAFGGPMRVLCYLGRYTHRVAISNHRLSAFDQERVTFRWKDYAHGGKQAKMTLGATEFLRRFFLHVLPKGFAASGTSAFSPIAFAPPIWVSRQLWPPVVRRSRKLKQTTPTPRPLLSGTARAAARR
jgi:Putative transposase